VLSTDQVLDLAEAVPDIYHRLIVAESGLGLRPAELFGLTIDRVDFLKRTVRVDQQLVRSRTDGGVKLSPKLKTRTSYRTLPLAPTVAEAIAAHLDLYGPHGELGLVFTNEWGGPIQQHPFSQMFENARLRAGIPEWKWGTKSRPPHLTTSGTTTPVC
jgi:integrase